MKLLCTFFAASLLVAQAADIQTRADEFTGTKTETLRLAFTNDNNEVVHLALLKATRPGKEPTTAFSVLNLTSQRAMRISEGDSLLFKTHQTTVSFKRITAIPKTAVDKGTIRESTGYSFDRGGLSVLAYSPKLKMRLAGDNRNFEATFTEEQLADLRKAYASFFDQPVPVPAAQ